ncbi:hypothetical protein H257_16011 [Aphanomyces astaci]|uniref:Uncharacterized protein n=1 Tax=Aphanomyces astaci TaxID=112090 RepID=W4FLW0_APHAT|nr:hypothetical protein H257_16011 [Aphanomyces astaci]ETV67886.1 hypothetical protein H257_16011 [Aphanomyces astaci]|eukprot:XP_009842631.1 hypothetical protein H257_16011 [Aphanomyces astaci]
MSFRPVPASPRTGTPWGGRINSKLQTEVTYYFYLRPIFPAVQLVLTFTLVMACVWLLDKTVQSMAIILVAGTLFGANIQLLTVQQGYFDASVKENPLLHLWSLEWGSCHEGALWPYFAEQTLPLWVQAPGYLWGSRASRGRSAVPGRSPLRGQAAMSAAAQLQVTPGGFSVLPASAWSSVWTSPTWPREDAQDGQLTAAERQSAADYRAGARAIAAPQQVVVPMSRTATAGESEAAEEEEPSWDPKDRLPSLHRS